MRTKGMIQMNVLMVDIDDQEFIRAKEYIETSFHPFGIKSASYDDEIEAILDREEISIVLIHVVPDDDRGVKVIQRIRAAAKFEHVYIMAWIPFHDIKQITNYFSWGADDCVLLPADVGYLHARLIIAENANNNKKATHAAFEAYSDLRSMHAQLVQSEKLAGIGRLAAGVAHEINNPLGFVSGNIEALEKYIHRYNKILALLDGIDQLDGEGRTKICDDIAAAWKKEKIKRVMNDMPDLFADTKDGVARISVIVTGLKNFSRTNQQEERSSFDLNAGIKTTLIVARNEIKYDSDVECNFGDIPYVTVNGGQINQVILNMLINAVHAIKEKFNGEKGNIVIKTYADEANVYVSLKDNGCGMSKETAAHVFEPFFTTKPIGVGTGLGLGIAYDIIYNKHGGDIQVCSEVGVGTEFIIRLPIEAVNLPEQTF